VLRSSGDPDFRYGIFDFFRYSGRKNDNAGLFTISSNIKKCKVTVTVRIE